MFIKLIKMLFPLFLICFTAVPEVRRYSGDYHLHRIKPFHHRNDSNHNHVFLVHVSNQCQLSCAFDWLILKKQIYRNHRGIFFLN